MDRCQRRSSDNQHAPPLIELKTLSDSHSSKPNAAHLVSMDSTDTFATCNTHPYSSEADLSAEDNLESHTYPNNRQHTNQKDSSNLYINPFDDPNIPCSQSSTDTTTLNTCPNSPTPRNSPRQRPLRVQAFTTDTFDDARSTDNLICGSRSSLQDSPLPKHRRTRFQEVRLLFLFNISFSLHIS